MDTITLKTLSNCSVVDLVAMIRRGDVSSTEIVEAHIQRIEQVNPNLNAVVIKTYEQARAAANEADLRLARGESVGPLHGIPITIKEIFDLTGTPSTYGLTSRVNSQAQKDDAYVTCLQSAGGIVVGKTNISQCLMFYESDNPVYGRTNNPWNPARTPGGSSGGESAIIAAGGSPLGIGTDIGGSVRVTAAFCGIAGFKPTNGRLPEYGRYSFPVGQRAVPNQVGIMARHVGDIALGLDVLNQVNVEPPLPLGDFRTIDIANLRVAYYVEDGTFSVAPAVRRAVLEAVELLKQRGVQVFEWAPPDVTQALHLWYALLSGDGGRHLKNILTGSKLDPRVKTIVTATGIPKTARKIICAALRYSGQESMADILNHGSFTHVAEHWELVEAQMDYQRRFQESLDWIRADAVLCPAGPLPAFPHGASNELGVGGAYFLLYNILGYPAGVVPFTRVRVEEEVGRQPSKDRVQMTAYNTEYGSVGLPIGVQVAARPWKDHVALALMKTLERDQFTHLELG